MAEYPLVAAIVRDRVAHIAHVHETAAPYLIRKKKIFRLDEGPHRMKTRLRSPRPGISPT